MQTKKEMKKVLFPTDFSDIATNAFKYALQFAHSIQAKLIVVHSYEMPVISSTSAGQPDLVQQVYESIEMTQFEQFKDKAPELRKIASDLGYQDVELEFVFEEGTLLYVINSVVEKEHIDFVVMGTNGASGFEKKLLGSNTVNVIRSLNIPVLSIPHKANFNGIKTIGFTTLFKDVDKNALKEILEIAELLQANVKVVHVTKTETNELEAKVKQWEQEFANERLSIQIIYSAEVEDSVFDFMKENNIDILAMVRRNRNFFDRLFGKSFTKELTHHSENPIMVLHEL